MASIQTKENCSPSAYAKKVFLASVFTFHLCGSLNMHGGVSHRLYIVMMSCIFSQLIGSLTITKPPGIKISKKESHNWRCLQFLMSCQQLYSFTTISAAILRVATGPDWKQGWALSLASNFTKLPPTVCLVIHQRALYIFTISLTPCHIDLSVNWVKVVMFKPPGKAAGFEANFCIGQIV